MGNPKRYIMGSDIFIARPVIDTEHNRVTFTVWQGHGYNHPDEHYDEIQINFYSAPDVIMQYSNGNTCKDEWRRYFRYNFKDLNLVSKEPDLLSEYCVYTYSYGEFKYEHFAFDDPELERDIPMGKFAGKTLEQVAEYKRLNKYQFKSNFKPRDS